MRAMRVLVLLLCASSAWADAPAKVAPKAKLDSAELAHKLEEALSGGKPRQSSAEIRKQLEALRPEVAPREQPLVDRMIKLLGEIDTLSAPELVTRSAQLTHDLAALAPDDFQVQRSAAAMLDHLWLMSSGLDGVPDLSHDARQAAVELTQKFPTQASAWGRLASHLINEEGSSEATLRALVKCVRLDPKAKWCSESFATVRSQYVQPRCTELAPEFALYRGNVEAASTDTPRAVTVGGRTYWTAARPALVARDLRAVEQVPGGGVLLTLVDRKKLEPFRASVAWKDAWNLLTIGNETVAAAPRASPLPQGLMLETALDLARICKNVQRRTLPRDL
jgi:hypothetical protein